MEMEKLWLYLLIQIIQSVKAAWFSKMRQQGKTEEEIKTEWRSLWEPFKLEDPTALAKVPR